MSSKMVWKKISRTEMLDGLTEMVTQGKKLKHTGTDTKRTYWCDGKKIYSTEVFHGEELSFIWVVE